MPDFAGIAHARSRSLNVVRRLARVPRTCQSVRIDVAI
jgi:hypothetical protein